MWEVGVTNSQQRVDACGEGRGWMWEEGPINNNTLCMPINIFTMLKQALLVTLHSCNTHPATKHPHVTLYSQSRSHTHTHLLVVVEVEVQEGFAAGVHQLHQLRHVDHLGAIQGQHLCIVLQESASKCERRK